MLRQNEGRPQAHCCIIPATRAFCLVLVLARAITPAAAAPLTERLKLTASDAAERDRLGVSVAISGNTAIVGAPRFGAITPKPGAAYLFDVTTGQELFKLTASNAGAGDRFGFDVAISGDIGLVGAPARNAAYVFDATTGVELFQLTASAATPSDRLGRSVAIDDTIAIVGGQLTGSAYAFDVTTGQELFQLAASDLVPGGSLGWSVGIGGKAVVVGAIADDGAAPDSGSAYLFAVPEPSSVVLGGIGLVRFLAYLVGPVRYTLSTGGGRNAAEAGCP